MSKHILVIDDDDAILEVLNIILVEHGYRVTMLEDSNTIDMVLNQKVPDLILLDIWMSGKDGIEIAKLIKGNERTRHIPVIMISANNEGERLAQDAGVEGYIAKPFDIETLLKTVGKHLT